MSTNYADGLGGISFLGLGDFRQVARVVSGSGESPSLAASVKSSLGTYKKNRVFTLNTSIRSIHYTRIVDDIGEAFSGERRCFIEVQIPNTTEIHCILRITLSFNPQGSSCTVNHRRFPLRAAYATTFNGSQGLTLQRAVIDLRSDPFDCKLYTALSRVRNGNDIRVMFAPVNEDRATANIVYIKDSSCSANETSFNIQ